MLSVVRVALTCFLGYSSTGASQHEPPQLLSKAPPVWIVDGFATDAECAELIQIGTPRLQPSVMHGPKGDTVTGHRGRSSWNGYVGQDESTLAKSLTLRAKRLVRNVAGALAVNLTQKSKGFHALQEVVLGEAHTFDSEPVQITRYKEGEIYAIHMDSMFHEDQPRVATAILYLDTPRLGGETLFPNIVEHAKGGFRGTRDPALQRVSCTRRSHVPSCSEAGVAELQSREEGLPKGVWLCCCAELLKVTPRVGRMAIFLPQWRIGKARAAQKIPHPGVGHVACPVGDGEVKHIAQFWFHNFWAFPTAPEGMPPDVLRQRLEANRWDEL